MGSCNSYWWYFFLISNNRRRIFQRKYKFINKTSYIYISCFNRCKYSIEIFKINRKVWNSMDKIKDKYFNFFLAGLFIGGMLGVIVINILVSYRVDNYIREIKYLNSIIEEDTI